MVLDIHFHNLQDERDLRKLVDFLHAQDLGYKNYRDWIQRTEHEFASGYKTAIIAQSENIVVGDIIWQPHKQLPRVRELKNLRVHPQMQGRYVGAFLLKQAEVEGKNDFDLLLGDVQTNQQEMIALLTLQGYTPLGKPLHLYSDAAQDIIMIKNLNRTTSGILYNAKKFFSLN